jgi:gliding motility-associated-like protein
LSINASTGAITPSASTAGTYIVTYTVAAAGGCAAVSDTATVTITAAPTATISYSSSFCNSDTTSHNVVLAGTGAYTGGFYSATPSGLTIVVSTGAITPNTSTAGTYTVTYTIPVSGGCAIVPVTTTVTITPTPVTPIISYSGPYCTSENAPQAVTQTGAIGGTYSASPSGLSINASTGAITPSASTAGTYIVTYTVAAAGGCAAVSDTATVTINAVPSFLNTSISICSDLPIGFTFPSITSPSVFSWNIFGTIMQPGLLPAVSNFQLGSTLNFSALANDVYTNTSGTNKTVTYKVVPTGSNGCLGDTFNIFVTILPEPVVSDTLYQDICSNTILDRVFPPSFPVLSPVWYYVNNLAFIGTVNIAGGQPIISNGGQILTNSFPYTASQDDIFLNLGSSTATVVYNVTPISDFGCIGSPFYMSVEILPNTTSIFVNGDSINDVDSILVCSGECLDLNLTSNSSLSPIWHYIPSNNNLQTPSQSVQFSPTISDCLINTGNDIEQIEYEVQFIVGSDPTAGCPSAPDTITIFVNPLPTVNPSTDLNLCHDFATNPILFTGNVTGSVYNWSSTNLNVGLTTLTGADIIPSFLTTNTGVLPTSTIVEVTPIFINNIQCEGPIDQFTITINPEPSVFSVNDIILCEGELSSSVILLGTLDSTIYNWENSNVSVGLASSGTGNIPVFTAQNPTLDLILSTVIVTPLYGLAQCPGDSISFDIIVKPAPTIIPQNASICSGDTLDINLSADLPSTFEWFATPNQNVLNETYTPTQYTDIINDLLVQTTTIPQTVQYNISAISTQYNCESSPTIFNVIVNPLPVPTFTLLNPPFCDLSPISFQNNTTGILDFTWSFGDGIYSNLYSPSHQFLTFGAYDIQLNAINPQTGCKDSIVNEIIISDTPSAAFSYSDSLGCGVLDVTYTADSSNLTWVYLWDFGNGETIQQASSVGYQFDLEGCYDVSLTVTNNNGCSSSDTIADIACVYDNPIASFSSDQYILSEIDPLVSFYNNSINANAFEWEFGDGTYSFAPNPTHSYPEDAASYLVTLVAYNEISCTDTVTMTIVILKDVGLYVPNSFTPDGDEYNHTFYPILTEGFKKDSYHMSIFDRWGELVFESYDPSFGWNGTYGKNGIQCQIGTYTWVIEVIELQSAENRKYSGHLNLIR